MPKPKLTRAQLDAIAQKLKAQQGTDITSGQPSGDSGQLPTVIPPADGNPRDHEFRDKVAVAIIREPDGNVENALQKLGVSWETYQQVVDHPDYNARFDQLIESMVVRPRTAAAKAAVMDKAIADGGAYHLKVLHDTRFQDRIGSEDSAFLESMSGAPRRTILKEARRLHDEIKKIIEALEGGMDPDDITVAEHRRAVTERAVAEKKKLK